MQPFNVLTLNMGAASEERAARILRYLHERPDDV
jgi:hypothetical protein